MHYTKGREGKAVTPERFVYYVLGILAVVLAVVLLIWIVDRLDDDIDDAMVSLNYLFDLALRR